MSGLYIHIPFCKSRCIYCGFYSTTLCDLRENYVSALCEELRLRSTYLSDRVQTIYLGGGTPSTLSPHELDRIFDAIYKYCDVATNGVEVTMECNPDDITPNFTTWLANSGHINRISMGAQSFNDEILRFIHRRHNSSQVTKAVDLLRKANINNISIDLMFGFPGESISMWQNDIQSTVKLGIEHISAYSLMYEEGTALYTMFKNGKIKECDEELFLTMYDTLIDRLQSAGYEHYEISNFCKPGFHSRHNSSYWHQIPYLGVGASAHSFNLMSRQWNVADLKGYIEAISNGVVPAEVEKLTVNSMYNEIVMTALRTKDGVCINNISKLGLKYKSYLLQEAEKHIANGRLLLNGDRLRLTRKGLFVSDDVMSDLMMVSSDNED